MPIGKLKGFLPYKLLDASRLEQRRPDGSLAPVPQSGYRQLIGTKLRVKVTQVGGAAVPPWSRPCSKC
jgi:hypothetical protein